MPLHSPIGIFDSGIGGLTVARAVRDHLPKEQLLYLGDTARLPYGTKSPQVVIRYTINCARFLCRQGAKAIVIACNTASAVAVEEVAKRFNLPVLGVIHPGAQVAAKRSRNRRIGVIGTEGTVASGRYQHWIQHYAPGATVLAQPCPLLVPLAEEGLVDHVATRLIAEEYLQPLLHAEIDTLVLGCTHYPILKETLAGVCGKDISIVDSATAVAQATRDLLERSELLSPEIRGGCSFFATDVNERFSRVGRAFWGADLSSIEWVDLEHHSAPGS